MNTKRFCEKNGIAIECTEIGADENPNQPDPKWQARHYRCRLTRGIYSHWTVYFSMGIALEREPEAWDVLDCIASDSATADQKFEDWASDLGYDSDSRKAFRTWEIVKRQAADLRVWLGNTLAEQLIYRTERL